ILGAEIVDRPRVEPWRPIPLQAGEVVANGMERALAGNLLDGLPGDVRANHDAVALKQFGRADVVCIRPITARQVWKWGRFAEHRPPANLVVRDPPPRELRRLAHERNRVCRGGEGPLLLVEL